MVAVGHKARLALLAFAWVLGACALVTKTPTEDPQFVAYTHAASTLAVELTLSAGNTAVARLTEIAAEPLPTISNSALPPPPTQNLATPTLSPPPPTATPPLLPCEAANYVADVTIPVNTLFAPGEEFVKTWRIENAGSCPWTPAYSLVFGGGDFSGGATQISLPESVQPGGRVDISLQMAAPSRPGYYQGYWSLVAPNGQVIGIMLAPMGALWVQIEVRSTESMRGEYDFATNYCAAQWVSNREYLTCPGSRDNPGGSMQLLNQPELESRKENEVAIWMRPGTGRNSWISAEYPAFRIHDGDHFMSEVGCLRDNPGCELVFELNYREIDNDVINLNSWYQSYDEITQLIEIDLSDLAGETVRFILRVTNVGKAADANAFWLVPRIENFSDDADLVIAWREEGGVRRICADVKVYLTGRDTAEARAGLHIKLQYTWPAQSKKRRGGAIVEMDRPLQVLRIRLRNAHEQRIPAGKYYISREWRSRCPVRGHRRHARIHGGLVLQNCGLGGTSK